MCTEQHDRAVASCLSGLALARPHFAQETDFLKSKTAWAVCTIGLRNTLILLIVSIPNLVLHYFMEITGIYNYMIVQ